MQPATQKPGASPETQHMMSSSRTGLGPAAPPTRALGNRIQSLHHFLQGHLFVSQPEPHSPQRRTVQQPGLPLHQRCFGGGEALGRGPPAPPARDWSRARPRGRVGGLLGGSGSGARPASLRSHLGTQRVHPRAASEALHKCTPAPARTRGSLDSPARAPSRRPGRSTSAPRGHLRAPRAGAPRRDLSPQPGPPLQPRSLRPPRRGAGSRRAASTQPARRYLRRPPGRCRGRSSRARPPRAAACRPRRPAASWSVGSRWSGGRRLPKDARRRREARAQAPAPRSRHAWHEATQFILHPAPCRSQSCVCPGPAPPPREARTLCAPRALPGVFPPRGPPYRWSV